MSRLNRQLLLGLTVVLVGGVLISSSSALDCGLWDNPCGASVSAEYYTGTPTAPCTVGNPVVAINASAKCKKIGPAGPITAYRCGAFGHPVVFSGSGVTHTITPDTTWGDAVESGKCKDLHYDNDVR